MDERKVNHVVVVYMDGSRDTWPDPITAAAEVYGVDIHGLGNAITKLQYAAVTPEEAGRITRDLLIEAVTAVTGADTAVAEEWLQMLAEAVKRGTVPPVPI